MFCEKRKFKSTVKIITESLTTKKDWSVKREKMERNMVLIMFGRMSKVINKAEIYYD